MNDTNLFGDSVSQLPDLTLQEPDRQRWSSMTQLLESHCSKQELLSYAEAFRPWFKHHGRVLRSTRDGRLVEATEAVEMTKTSSTKHTIAQGVAMVLADEHNLAIYLATFSPELWQLWRMVFFNRYVTQAEAKRILKIKSNLFGQKRSAYYYTSSGIVWNKPEYGWFSLASLRESGPNSYGYRDMENYITVNSLVYSLFLPYVYPEAFDTDTALDSMPEGQWRTLSVEVDSYSNFQLFKGLAAQGAFTVKAKGVGVADLKRAAKKMTLEEFFPGDSNEYRHNLRAYSYLQLLVLCNQFVTKGNELSYEDTLRQLLAELPKLSHYLCTMLYPHIKGLRRQMTDYGRQDKLCKHLLTWAAECQERWVSVYDVFLKIGSTESGTSSTRFTSLVFAPQDEEWRTQMTNEYSGRNIAADRYAMEFGYTGLQACAFLLASIGVFEVALSDDLSRGASPFDTLEFFRLTPLGRYALGLTDEYAPVEQAHVAYFELDPDRLIIRSLQDPNPYAQLLLDTSTPISSTRYETSALSFLANCHKREDVESKISIFRQFIANDLPPLWEQFFQQLLSHCHPLQEDHTDYKRYTLPPPSPDAGSGHDDSRELIRLITTDPVLRQIVIRAEGYRIMVRAADLKMFELQLKKHGYLL